MLEIENDIANVLLQEIMSGSSSGNSSDSDDENVEVLEQLLFEEDNHQRRKIPRVKNFIENVIVSYTDLEFQEHFRLSRNTFEYLLLLIRPDIEGKLCEFGRNPISSEKQLYITLYILGTPDSYRSVTTKFDVGLATAWRTVKKVVKAICKLRNHFIRWPSNDEATETSLRIERTYGFPGVIGCVDGTHVRISAPNEDTQSYINRKGFHSILLQVVCNEKLEFIHCYVGLPGSVHDMRVFKFSGLQQRCTEELFPNNTHLLGDSAYTLQEHIMTPYRDNGHLTRGEINYNKVLSSTRMMVERSIGLLKNRWRYFLDKLPMRKTSLIPYYVLCACILHNLCLQREDTMDYPVIIPDTIDDNLEPLDVTEELRHAGHDKRDELRDVLIEDM